MTKFWFLSLILGCLLISLPLQAQTFEDGYQSYVRNQFPVAELQFKSALKKAGADEEKSFILKFIGICQYMRGDKKNSGQSFMQALTLDRNVQIDSDEVLDPTVVSFFNNIKSHLGPDTRKREKSAQAAEVSPESSGIATSQPQKSSSKNKVQPEASAFSTATASGTQASAKNGGTLKKSKSRKKMRDESSLGLDSNVQISEKSRRLHFTQFLPFGFPQFHNDSYILGGGAAVLQVAALASVVSNNKTITDRQKLNTFVSTKPGLTDQQREDFYSANNKFIADVKQKKNLALFGFVAVWGASVAESILLHKSSAKSTVLDLPIPPKQSLEPIIQADRRGETYGLSWQTELK
ncbi:MAG: hypothetical protein H7249_19325 [Chitinophagaceae bacterium]|nr:hypothetical protein [Oligoflexus sp.]